MFLIPSARLPRPMLGATLSVVAALAYTPAFAVCGDAILDAGEACDDDNVVDGDGCDSACQVEVGFECVDGTFNLSSPNTGPDNDNNFPHAGPVWTPAADLLSVSQGVNSDPGVYVTELDSTGNTLVFDISVTGTGDDDFVGFVLGYDDGEILDANADYLLVDWKRASQTYAGLDATIGMALSHVQGASDSTDFWDHSAPVNETARATTLGSVGWAHNTKYRFEVEYTATSLKVWVDDVLQFDEVGTMPLGNFGLYTFGQPNGLFELIEPLGQSYCHDIAAPNNPTVVSQINGDGLPVITGTYDVDDLAGTQGLRVTVVGVGEFVLGVDSELSVAPDGTWELDLSGLAVPLTEDTYQVNVNQIDDGGNEASDNSVDELIVDFDPDSDGLTTPQEEALGTDPFDPDSDNDGLSDEAELNEYGTNPVDADTDGDGLEDGAERNEQGTNPLAADTDGDGLADGDEVDVHGTDPLVTDTDTDGLGDGEELAAGTDPLDPNDPKASPEPDPAPDPDPDPEPDAEPLEPPPPPELCGCSQPGSPTAFVPGLLLGLLLRRRCSRFLQAAVVAKANRIQ